MNWNRMQIFDRTVDALHAAGFEITETNIPGLFDIEGPEMARDLTVGQVINFARQRHIPPAD